jgi:hypothetical protein
MASWSSASPGSPDRWFGPIILYTINDKFREHYIPSRCLDQAGYRVCIRVGHIVCTYGLSWVKGELPPQHVSTMNRGEAYWARHGGSWTWWAALSPLLRAGWNLNHVHHRASQMVTQPSFEGLCNRDILLRDRRSHNVIRSSSTVGGTITSPCSNVPPTGSLPVRLPIWWAVDTSNRTSGTPHSLFISRIWSGKMNPM